MANRFIVDLFSEEEMEQRKKEYLTFLLGENAQV
jgi:hypothetical protein